MKNIVIVVTCLFTIGTIAQKKQKIKGDKNVVNIYKELDLFSQIEITDDFDVFIMQTNSNGYHLKADSNLIDVIKLDVNDGVLKIYSTHKIVSSKKIEIHITFQEISSLNISKKAKVEGQNKLNLTDFTLHCSENASFELDINSINSSIKMDDSTSGGILLKSTNTNTILNDNAYLKGIISIKELNLTVNKRADMKLEGNVEKLNLTTTGSSDIKAKGLNVTDADLNMSNSSDIYLYVSKGLSIYAKGKSFVYVYGNPDITVHGLSDKSQIIKK